MDKIGISTPDVINARTEIKESDSPGVHYSWNYITYIVDLSDEALEKIRQIVREEIAEHRYQERLDAKE